MNLQRFLDNVQYVRVGNVTPRKPITTHNSWNVSAFDSFENPFANIPGGLGGLGGLNGLGSTYNPDDTVQKFLLAQAETAIFQRSDNINEQNHSYMKDIQYMIGDFNDVKTAHPDYLTYTFTKGDTVLLHPTSSIEFQNMRVENSVFLFDVVWMVPNFYWLYPNMSGMFMYVEAHDDVFNDFPPVNPPPTPVP